ncbi:MAG TPA: hypothetical protein PLH56_04550 [Candidatus Omnitrophota bacterium]|nr:hypothetical protein [Candidatus Omnitrophota bacterium]HPN88590.1 hypothetical protein [Candidatus Omnitrophota bacterium]
MKKYLPIIFIAPLYLALNIFLKPYLVERKAIEVVEIVFDYLKKSDPFSTYRYWQDPQKSPPISQILSYKILTKKVEKNKASATARLELPADQFLPSGKTWNILLEKNRFGWQIIEMTLIP